MVTAIVYWVPDWAKRSCKEAVAQMFRDPTDQGSKYYGLFAQFIAYYFNGKMIMVELLILSYIMK